MIRQPQCVTHTSPRLPHQHGVRAGERWEPHSTGGRERLEVFSLDVCELTAVPDHSDAPGHTVAQSEEQACREGATLLGRALQLRPDVGRDHRHGRVEGDRCRMITQ